MDLLMEKYEKVDESGFCKKIELTSSDIYKEETVQCDLQE